MSTKIDLDKEKLQQFKTELKNCITTLIADNEHSPAAAEEVLALLKESKERSDFILDQLARISNKSALLRSKESVAMSNRIVGSFPYGQALPESLMNIMRPIIGSSYRFQRAAWWQIGKMSKMRPSFLSKKDQAREFAEKIGMRLPAIYQIGVPYKNVELKGHTVVKPLYEDGGRAVHAFSPAPGGGYVDQFKKNKFYPDIDAIRTQLAMFVESTFVKQDKWLVEELVTPASGLISDSRDLKFFAFYGKIGCVLQVDRWSGPSPSRAIFDVNGETLNVSPFYPKPKARVEPAFTREDIEYVAEISKMIPWPGVRIDFLPSSRGLVFGEFTFNPGAYGGFFPDVDRMMGTAWAGAAARLLDDLLLGKTFHEFVKVESTADKSPAQKED